MFPLGGVVAVAQRGSGPLGCSRSSVPRHVFFFKDQGHWGMCACFVCLCVRASIGMLIGSVGREGVLFLCCNFEYFFFDCMAF